MKNIALPFIFVLSCLLIGCGSSQPLPETPNNKEAAYLKPGQKVNDVMVHIDK
jgi:hypothetical protein